MHPAIAFFPSHPACGSNAARNAAGSEVPDPFLSPVPVSRASDREVRPFFDEPASGGWCDRLAGLATAARSSAGLGLAIGAAVTTGLAAKAGYVAAMMSAPAGAHRAVSTGIVLGSAACVQSGIGALLEGARGLQRDPPMLSPGLVRTVKALGVAAYLCAMLGSAWRAMQDGDPAVQPLGSYMLANAAGQVLSGLVVEIVANRLVPHALLATERVDGAGLIIERGSPQDRVTRPRAETALIAGQVLTHAALMWGLLDKIPAAQQALGAPAAFRPGQDSSRDHLLAGLGVALVIGTSEAARVSAGDISKAVAQTLQGQTIRLRAPQVPSDPQPLGLAPEAPEDGTLSCWQRCRDAFDHAARRIGLGDDARGRMAGYVPLLNLSVDALTTGPRSGVVTGLAAKLGRPVFEVALGLSHFAFGMINGIDLLLSAKAAVPSEPVRAGHASPALAPLEDPGIVLDAYSPVPTPPASPSGLRADGEGPSPEVVRIWVRPA